MGRLAAGAAWAPESNFLLVRADLSQALVRCTCGWAFAYQRSQTCELRIRGDLRAGQRRSGIFLTGVPPRPVRRAPSRSPGRSPSFPRR